MQMTVPSFEFPRDIPRSVNFIGTPPIIPNQVPLPPLGETTLDGFAQGLFWSRRETVANHDFQSAGRADAGRRSPMNPTCWWFATARGGRPIDAISGPNSRQWRALASLSAFRMGAAQGRRVSSPMAAYGSVKPGHELRHFRWSLPE